MGKASSKAEKLIKKTRNWKIPSNGSTKYIEPIPCDKKPVKFIINYLKYILLIMIR